MRRLGLIGVVLAMALSLATSAAPIEPPQQPPTSPGDPGAAPSGGAATALPDRGGGGMSRRCRRLLGRLDRCRRGRRRQGHRQNHADEP